MNTNCIFCDIVSGKAKSYTVYEDENVKAFLDISQLTSGHTLVIPKQHYTDIYDMPEALLIDIARVARKLALRYRKALGAGSVNLIQSSGKESGQEVFHFHMHLVPRYEDDGLKNLWDRDERTEKVDIEEAFKAITKS